MQSLNQSLVKKDDSYEMSIYKGELSDEGILGNTLILNRAFPSLPSDFFIILSDRVKSLNFNDERLTAAVNYVIDTCIYPTPTIAQFISFDRYIKLYEYKDVVNITNELSGSLSQYYKPVRIGDRSKALWVSIGDFEQYKMMEFKK